jgi:ABC-2 type transport system ATP-binding protein
LPALEIRNLTAGYGNRTIIRDISLEVERGECVCILGINGAGKSTLLGCIGGRVQPSAGTLYIEGYDADKHAAEARRRLGFVVQPEQLPGLLSGRQCLEVYAFAKGLERIDAEVLTLIERFRLSVAMDSLVDTWSLGMRQKLAVLQALLGEPALIILDEAFNGLDPASADILRQELTRRLEAGRCAVLLATHGLDLVQRFGTRAVVMHEGRIKVQWRGSGFTALCQQGNSALAMATQNAIRDTP